MIQMLHSITDLLKVELGKDSISFLDSSCGDMFWMPEFLEQRSDVKYTGYDLADGNIASNRDKHANKGWSFKVNKASFLLGLFCHFSNMI